MGDTVTITKAEHDALLWERQFWRVAAACRILVLARGVAETGRIGIGARVPRSVLVSELQAIVDSLQEALNGQFDHDQCESCGKPIRPGEVCVPYADGVKGHADCDDQTKHAAGERWAVKREEVELEEGEPFDGFITLYEASPLYDDAGIAGILKRATTALAIIDQRAA